MKIFNLQSLKNVPRCFQSINPTFIDLIFTNQKASFKNSYSLEVGISNHSSLITTALRSQLVKGNVKLFQDYIIFNINSFNKDLEECFKKHTIYGYSHFQNVFVKFLNKHKPVTK